MTLEVTCHEQCPEQLSNATCIAKAGCQWHNDTFSCKIQDSETFGGNGWIGVVLSMVGDIIINIGMNLMKYAHNQNTDEKGEPIKHFTRIPAWWGGITGIIGGELMNLVAYGYAPASVVTPIGSIGVVTNVYITTQVLGEPFTMINMLGVLCVIGGIVMIVIFAPQAVIVISSDRIWTDVIYTFQGAVYLGVLVVSLAIMYPVSKKYGKRTVVVYMSLCTIIASLTIVCAKTFSSIFASAIENGFETEFLSPVPYVTILVMVVTAVVSTAYVNKAMMEFGNSQVVPTYFAMFTTCSVASVAWVYREFDCLLDLTRSILFLLGILSAIVGVCLVQYGVDDKVHPAPEDDKKDLEAGRTPSSAKGSRSNGNGNHPDSNGSSGTATDKIAIYKEAEVAVIHNGDSNGHQPLQLNEVAAASSPDPSEHINQGGAMTSTPDAMTPKAAHNPRQTASAPAHGVSAESLPRAPGVVMPDKGYTTLPATEISKRSSSTEKKKKQRKLKNMRPLPPNTTTPSRLPPLASAPP